jgi:hypothetical protein
VTDYSFVLPEDFDDYAFEVESKGWFAEARLSLSGRQYRLSFYDSVRLRQEIEDELRRGNIFFEPNLVVVQSVTRRNMEKAAELVVRSGRSSSLIGESATPDPKTP